MKKKIKYSIGLDIGTSSVGWAVTDETGKLTKFKKKNMWGVRLFEEAKPAKARRVSRGTRRRYNKRRERLRWLDEFFMDEVSKMDPLFKERMKNLSYLDKEDKSNYLNENVEYNLFVGNYTDKEYFKEYPTVYHLREKLMQSTEKADARLVYLALHHIIKYRGNFLYEGQTFNLDNTAIEETFYELFNQISEFLSIELSPTKEQLEKTIQVLKSKKSGKDKVAEIIELDYIRKNKQIKAVFNGIVGLNCQISTLFDEDYRDENDKKIIINFQKSTLEEKRDDYEKLLDVKYELIDTLHKIYSWIVLQDILDDTNRISKAMIKKYEQHKEDLKTIKRLFKKNYLKEYKEIFKSKKLEEVNYHNYIYHSSKMSQKELCKKIAGILKNKPVDSEEYRECLKKAEGRILFPKPKSSDNGVIPHQLHLAELEEILKNQEKYYPGLKENHNKICKLISFRYPYYVGPLSKESPFAWLKRKNDERIAPWNLDETVDIDETAITFIERMLNHCTYFPEEYVLPMNSLYISKFNVLNELNKISVNDKGIGIVDKKKIYKDLFLKKKKVTDKDLKEWMHKNQVYLNNDTLTIKGYQKDEEFASNLAPWIDFTNILGEINSDNIELIEKIILWITIFEDKAILERKLKNETSCTKEQISKILSLNYKGWSRLSKKLLVDCTSKGDNILDIMYDTKANFMQVINDEKYTFKKQIEEAVKLKSNEIIYDDIESLGGSPALKRGVWQSVLIVKEIIKVMKCEPQNIFLEFARNEGKKKRTKTRVERLSTIYKSINNDNKSMHEEEIYNELNKLDKKSRFSSERLYLYYLQYGKCMYTGEKLDIDHLALYDIDHIIPQSLILDDSIDNKVLVIKKENARKSDSLVLDSKIVQSQLPRWNKLKKYGLMSSKKYNNLTRTEYRKEDHEGFINRQLVETRQISKHVARLLTEAYQETNIMLIRADMVSNFRRKYDLPKLRDVNDLHHAHDAFIVNYIGQFIAKRFTYLTSDFIYNQYKRHSKDKPKGNYGFVLGCMDQIAVEEDTGEVWWDPNSRINYVIRAIEFKDYYITKKLDPQHGKMFNLTVLPGDKNSKKGVTEAKIPVNKYRKNVNKYGGFSSLCMEYYLPVSYTVEKKKNGKLEGIPIYLQNASDEEIMSYLCAKLKTDEVEIIGDPIYKYAYIQYQGDFYYLTSYQEIVNAKQFMPSLTLMRDIEKILYSRTFSKLDMEQSDSMNKLFDELCHLIGKYYQGYQSVLEKIISKRDAFIHLEVNDKKTVLKEILKLTKADAGNLDLKLIGLSSQLGRKNNRNIDLSDVKIFRHSVTGMYGDVMEYELEDGGHN